MTFQINVHIINNSSGRESNLRKNFIRKQTNYNEINGNYEDVRTSHRAHRCESGLVPIPEIG